MVCTPVLRAGKGKVLALKASRGVCGRYIFEIYSRAKYVALVFSLPWRGL